ncbi:acyl-CoA dehydrogenase [Actinomadura livida]|uniref:Acyl-CoA dehydrogenase n=1 Tax=Actinomadura livida TaxID=79909 RepID=A0A7W7IIM6_9ACTN|nr:MULTISPECIES: acyl-CoA dehydrogenase [Actinomadura]MBB4777408.1 alkylation response protein AidB-like acyl-CoA dehydrogenase [Actinomadura catellatispora]GGU31775.1 acyl-CoA dehydrogenase [Actinomadura livida]
MTIGLTEEHRDLRDAVRAFTSRQMTRTVVRAAVDAEREKLPAFWDDLAAQGLLGLHLPENAGGAGFGMVELAIVVEELGRAIAPGPFLPTVLASAVLHRAGHAEHLPLLADGTKAGAVGLEAGGLALSRSGSEVTLTGTSGPVMGPSPADVLVLPAKDGDGTAWIVVPRDRVKVHELPGHDLTRRLARIESENTTIPARSVLNLDSQDVRDLAAVLFAAEASGLADWATYTAAEYAKVREQFGRPIGQFQGVKHRCARMLAHAEQARACAWDAARAQDETRGRRPGSDPREAALAAAVAGATSVQAAFQVAKDCIQTLGGIGFTWEHDASLCLRRAQTLRILLGPTARWRRRVARLTLDGVRRELAVELPPEAGRIRAEVRAELEPAKALDGTERRTYLADRGYTSPHLPVPWGKGADAVTQLVIAEEMRAAGLRAHDMVIGNWVVPTLIEHGSPAQHERFLPGSLRGAIRWCQLFSEPGAGSDLAALSTRAEKVEGGWEVTGQKVWTSMAREADWGILLARTDPSVPKHKGLSYFLLDMSSPGIDIRPLRELTGDTLFNEVFLDGVFIPDDLLVAAPGDGWKLARTTLANERVSLSNDSSLGSGGEALLELAAGGADDERLTTLGGILCDAQSSSLFGLRTTLRSLAGGQPGAESSIGKLIGVEHMQQVWETAVDWIGPDALTGESEGGMGDPTWMFLNSRNLSIAGGTTDVQLNIIAERLLGLPRDPMAP